MRSRTMTNPLGDHLRNYFDRPLPWWLAPVILTVIMMSMLLFPIIAIYVSMK